MNGTGVSETEAGERDGFGVTLRSRDSSVLGRRVAAAARLAIGAGAGTACTVAYERTGDRTVVAVPERSSWTGIAQAVLRRYCNNGGQAPRPPMRHSPRELAAIGGVTAVPERNVGAVSVEAASGSARAQVVLFFGWREAAGSVSNVASMLARCVVSLIEAQEQKRSRLFWRGRAMLGARQTEEMRSRLDKLAAERGRLGRALERARALRPRSRFSGLGSIMASLGPFEAWVVAVKRQESLRVAAASVLIAVVPELDENSALVSSLDSGRTVLRDAQAMRAQELREDRLFERFRNYLCVPFTPGAIALAAHQPIAETTVRRVEEFASLAAPLAAQWLAEAEVERLRGLVAELGLRMFHAVDLERAKIARDLHDDQAQLFAAARIAISAPRDRARAVLGKIETELRRRVRDLKPVALGKGGLGEALRTEARRLAAGGIAVRLHGVETARRISRALQLLCYQVAREALANVVRHSGASQVDVWLGRDSGTVHLEVSDNGRGFASGGAERGSGLAGLSERLALAGGKLTVESRAGLTRLRAEFPEV